MYIAAFLQPITGAGAAGPIQILTNQQGQQFPMAAMPLSQDVNQKAMEGRPRPLALNYMCLAPRHTAVSHCTAPVFQTLTETAYNLALLASQCEGTTETFKRCLKILVFCKKKNNVSVKSV